MGVTAIAQTSVTTGGQRYTVIEDVTGAWCQYCPDGTVVQEEALAQYPKAIGTALHNADKMVFTDGNTVQASPNVVCGYPGGLIDRKNWNGAYTGSTCTTATSVSRSYWKTLASQQIATTPKWDVTVTHSFNTSDSTVTVNVTARAIGNQTGNYNINAWIIEDSVVGPNITGYNQVNYYNTVSTHTYYQAGNPMVGFVHRHVERAYLGGAWGTTGVIPANAANNMSYTKTYTYKIPAKYDLATAGAPATQFKQISIIGMVMKDTSSKFDREIMNAVQAKLVMSPTSVGEVTALNNLSVYPNPAQTNVTIKGILNQPGAVTVSVVNAIGQTMIEKNYKYTGSFFGEDVSLETLTNGVYMLNITTDRGEKTTEKLVISK